jgi:hypothetical protein
MTDSYLMLMPDAGCCCCNPSLLAAAAALLQADVILLRLVAVLVLALVRVQLD